MRNRHVVNIALILILGIYASGCDCFGPKIPQERKIEKIVKNGITINPTVHVEKNKNLKYFVEVQYPELSGIKNKESEKKLNLLISAAASKAIENFKKSISEWNTDLTNLDEFPGESSLYIGYEVIDATQRVVSLKLNFSIYFAGAAHPSPSFMTINYDLGRNASIKLADLFEPSENYLGAVSNFCIKELINNNEYSDSDWIKKGAGRNIKNYNNFNLSEKGIVITFDVYQVGPYAEGPKTVTIPYSQLKDLLNPESPIAAFQK